MNIVNILEEIEKVDAEIYERLNPRRAAMKDFFNMSKKITLSAMPLAMGALFQKAYGQTAPATVNEVLNFALTLEYLEYHFYNHAVVAAPGLIPAGTPAVGAITTIRDHEKAHVDLLKGALGAAARPALAYTDFDFTAKGTFPDVYTSYQTFLAVAQAFEDTGVRAYKGQAGVLKGNAVLTTALQIHSVEARHAAHIRFMRSGGLNGGGAAIKPWISLGTGGGANDTGIPQVDAVYAGEDLDVQTGVTITGIATGVTKAKAVESFDEPLNSAQVLAIAGLFIK
ncbi:rubrerythrin [Pedobacter africanus]|uniref:Rubrerythrin n=1 Tax=Pedobacter africanus TaxID=151894 RepID=A0ACC6L237_9SPHI|nr:ferritin-like domain-containing protein [Pedobacter africanus]MDR6785401.1 rubrerythrin [Pedobacter africanus]